MTTAYSALWADGKTAGVHAVVLHIHTAENELWIWPGGENAGLEPVEPIAKWPLNDVVLLSRSTQDPPLRLRLRGDSGERLTVRDKDSIAALAPFLEGVQKRQKKMSLRRWLIGTAAVWGVFALLFFGGPVVTDMLAYMTPRSWEASLGQKSRDKLVAAFGYLHEEKNATISYHGTPYIQKMVDRLAAATDANGYTFHITVIDSSMVNALALPGGYIIVFSGLIEHCETPDQLAGVLAHEMAHVTEQHGLSMFFRSYLWEFLTRTIGGTDAAGSAMSSAAVIMMHSSYSQKVEQEADLLGVQRLVAAHIDPQGLAQFFQRLGKIEPEYTSVTGKMLSYLSTHPALEARNAYVLEARAAKGAQPYTPALTPGEWILVKAIPTAGKKKGVEA